MLLRKAFFALVLLNFIFPSFAKYQRETSEALPVYTQAQLIRLFETNSHLNRVKEQDDCQLLQDIEARAIRLALPAYQFLYGDMLAWGVCLEQDPDQGLHYMRQAAEQGLSAALEQLGRYYANGVLVQQDRERAIFYLREAASLGNTKACMQFAKLLLADFGSPLDYENAYRWLYQTVTADKSLQQKITKLRQNLADRMPAYVIERAKKRAIYW